MDTSGTVIISAVVGAIVGALVTGIVDRVFLLPGWLEKRKQQRILVDLSVLRGEGIRIQNDGLQPLSPTDRDKWIERIESWKTKTYAKASELSETASMNLRDLGTFPRVAVTGVNDPDQLKALGDLIETLRRLSDLIIEYRRI